MTEHLTECGLYLFRYLRQLQVEACCEGSFPLQVRLCCRREQLLSRGQHCTPLLWP